jgi:hypothetical protein
MSTRSRFTLVVIARVTAVVLIASSSALAVVDDATAPVTTDDYDGLWHNSDVAVTLTPVDDLSGVAATYYSTNGVDYVPGLSFLVPALPLAANDGEHTVTYYSVDGVGNAETPKSVVVKLDTQAPVTSVLGSEAAWYRTPAVLHFGAFDQIGLSGVAKTQSKIDGRAWTDGAAATVEAPANHSWDGTHTVYFRSLDNAGNLEANQSLKVRIDTRGPACSAPSAASAVQGSYATLKYRVSDALSSQATVTIKVKAGSRTVKTISLGKRYTNKALSYRLKCVYAPKTYRYYVYAKDLAGNNQAKVGVNTLTVKPRVLASISASISDSTPAQYSDVTAYCTAKDQTGHRLPGVRVSFAWHYKTTTPSESRTTNANGVAACTRYISGATEGYRVVISITASYKGVVKTASTSFTPH